MRLIARRTRTVWLAGRPSAALEQAAEQLRGHGADVHTVAFDALDPDAHETALGKVFTEGDVDMVLLAFGILGDQARDERELAAAVRVAQTNYTGAVSAALVSARALQTQGHGSLVVLSSVIGERARRSDFIYGSSKAGLDAFAQGLGDALHGTGAHVMVVRPGFVRSKMTMRPSAGTVRDDTGGGRDGRRTRAAATLGDGVGAGRAPRGDVCAAACAAGRVPAAGPVVDQRVGRDPRSTCPACGGTTEPPKAYSRSLRHTPSGPCS